MNLPDLPDFPEDADVLDATRVRGYRHVSYCQVLDFFARRLVYMVRFRLLPPGRFEGARRRWERVGRRRWMLVFNPTLRRDCDLFDVRKLVLMNPDGMTRYSFTEFPEGFDVLESIGFGPFSPEAVVAAEGVAVAALAEVDEEAAPLMRRRSAAGFVPPVSRRDYGVAPTSVGKLKQLRFYRDVDPDWPVGGWCQWPPAG